MLAPIRRCGRFSPAATCARRPPDGPVRTARHQYTPRGITPHPALPREGGGFWRGVKYRRLVRRPLSIKERSSAVNRANPKLIGAFVVGAVALVVIGVLLL